MEDSRRPPQHPTPQLSSLPTVAVLWWNGAEVCRVHRLRLDPERRDYCYGNLPLSLSPFLPPSLPPAAKVEVKCAAREVHVFRNKKRKDKKKNVHDGLVQFEL
ncbi:hypothetical protein E2C01_083223 [Portunus trituberculatus]|uniref:Uncharacterized protein n=1 Tax=Portunus trituberculatus TaxID=210409 RepID=A0A5B7IWM5_PORTR|nr:hypothetical protein [Portunus trituberculatus]